MSTGVGSSASKVELCDITRHHLDAFWAWASDDVVTQSLLWDSYTERSEAEKFLITVAEPHPWFKAISYQGKVVGSMTLDRRKGARSCTAELGYVIAREYWGRGIATEAIKIAISRGFKDLDVIRMEALVDPDNIGSQRALERAGFSLEGVLRKCIVHRGEIRDRMIYACIKETD